MTHKVLKLAIAGVTLAGAVTYLAMQGLQSGLQYDVGVDEYLAKSELHGKRTRIAGTVGEADYQVKVNEGAADFFILGQEKRLRVTYRGAIPDLFKAGSAVAVEGKEDGLGVFRADKLMTKCASKYEAKLSEGTTQASGGQEGGNAGASGGQEGGTNRAPRGGGM